MRQYLKAKDVNFMYNILRSSIREQRKIFCSTVSFAIHYTSEASRLYSKQTTAPKPRDSKLNLQLPRGNPISCQKLAWRANAVECLSRRRRSESWTSFRAGVIKLQSRGSRLKVPPIHLRRQVSDLECDTAYACRLVQCSDYGANGVRRLGDI